MDRRFARQKEQRIHGNMRFPAATYELEWAPGEQIVDLHWHDEAEFFLVLSGRTRFQIDERRYDLHAGEAVFVKGGALHAAYALPEEGCRFVAFVFDYSIMQGSDSDRSHREIADPLLAQERTLPALYASDTDWGASINGHLLRIRDHFDLRRPGFELAVKAHLYLILSEIAAGSLWISPDPRAASGEDKLNRLKDALRFIDERYSEKLSLKQLAEAARMSEGHFCRIFKSMIRKTPLEYINSLRVRRAAVLLEQSDLKTIEVALSVGFEHMSYFTKKFKEEMHVTPTEYRQKIKNGQPSDLSVNR